MNTRSLLRIFNQWSRDFYEYHETIIGDNSQNYAFEVEDRFHMSKEINKAMDKDREVNEKTKRLIEHILVNGIKSGIITSINEANHFLQVQICKNKVAFEKPFFYIEVDTKYHYHRHPVTVPKLELYPFGEVWRAIGCETFYIGQVPAKKWKIIYEGSDAVQIICDSLLDGRGIKNDDLNFEFDFEGEWLKIDCISVHDTKVPGMRLRRLKTFMDKNGGSGLR